MRPCGFVSAGSSYYKMWVGLNGFDPRNDFMFGIKVGMGCMNLVTVVSKYTRVPVTLRSTMILIQTTLVMHRILF